MSVHCQLVKSCPYPGTVPEKRNRIHLVVCREHRKFLELEQGSFDFDMRCSWANDTEQLWAESSLYLAPGTDQHRFVPLTKDGEFNGFAVTYLRDWKSIGSNLGLALDDYRDGILGARFIQVIKRKRREEFSDTRADMFRSLDRMKRQLHAIKATNGFAKTFVWTDLLEQCRELAIGESALFEAIGKPTLYRSKFLTMLGLSGRTTSFTWKTSTEGRHVRITKTGAYVPLYWRG